MSFGGLRLHTPSPHARRRRRHHLVGGRAGLRREGRGILSLARRAHTRHVLKHAILSGIRRWLQDHTESPSKVLGFRMC